MIVQVWKTVRVFISSTFRDVHAERDYLSRVVFPELREQCARRCLQLVDKAILAQNYLKSVFKLQHCSPEEMKNEVK
jgi:hypothetical protein